MQAFANTDFKISDRTVQPNTQPVGVPAMAIKTQRGRIGEAVFLRSWEEYRREFGEIIDPDDALGPIYAKRVFDNGGQLYVSRLVHFTDINDPTTATVVTATGSNGGTFNLSYKIVAVDITNDTLTVQGDVTAYVTAGQTHTVQKVGGGTTVLTVDTGAATYSGGLTTIEYVAIIAGDASPLDSLTWSVTLTTSLTYEASSPGAWGNSVSVEIVAARSGLANAVDIIVRSTNATVIGTDLNESYSNFPTSPTTQQINAFNLSMRLIQLDVVTAPIGVVPPNNLSGGTDDYASVSITDVIGSSVGGTGLRSFDNVSSGFVRLSVPEFTSNIVDNEVLNYCILRKNCRAILRTPESVNGYTAIDYRNAVGVYAGGTKIDDWRATMLYGGITIKSPYPPDNEAEITISWIGDFLGLSAKKDMDFGAWYNTSNIERGTIKNAVDIVYNLDTFSRLQEFNDVCAAGLYPIKKVNANGVQTIVSWGDRTLQVASSLLQFDNVADLCIYIGNSIKPITDGQLFNPNDVNTWKAIYRSVSQLMENIKKARGIENFRYEGDQDVKTASEAVINTPADIANGIYKFNLFFIPITSLREVQVTGIVTNAGVTFS